MDVRLTAGAWTEVAQCPVRLTLEAAYWDGVGWVAREATPALLTPQGLDAESQAGGTSWIDAECWVQDLRREMRAAPENWYVRFELDGLPAERLLRYRVTAEIPGTDREVSVTRRLWLAGPEFDHDSIVESFTNHDCPSAERERLTHDQYWVLMRTTSDDPETGERVTHLRLDLLEAHAHDSPRALPPVEIYPGTPDPLPEDALGWDGPGIEWDAPPGPGDLWPYLDVSTGSLRLTIPAGAVPREITIRTGAGDRRRTHRVGLDLTPSAGGLERVHAYAPTTVMLIQYAIQGFNDLFESPHPSYQPPRSFAQVIWQDENATFSGRPERPENRLPDGYAYALHAQEVYRVRTHWALNAGLLTLLRHGLSDEQFERLRRQVTSGLISASNAGFGAHRNSYFQAMTNVQELRLGHQVIDELLGPGACDGVIYPDQRLYKAEPGEVDAYRELGEEGKAGYLVLDRSTVADAGGRLFGNGTPTGDDGNFLWEEPATGLRLLLIEDQLRDELLAGHPEDMARGRIGLRLRRRLMQAVRYDKGGKRRLFVCGDDAEHYSGAGWFDGSADFAMAYGAALRWIRHHPWVRATNLRDPAFVAEDHLKRLSSPVSSAVCPSVDPDGVHSVDRFGKQIHFDAWYDSWKRFPAWWLGTELEPLSHELEQALIDWPVHLRESGPYRLAWMYFLACTQENAWSKQPLETNPNADDRWWEPEDFAISQALQQRHAWVFLNASLWASPEVAGELGSPRPRTYVIARSVPPRERGPLQAMLDTRGSANPPWRPPVGQQHHAWQTGCYWDHDLLDTAVLYNRELLVVVDRNGGCLTNILVRRPDDPDQVVSVSGTLKSHQFLSFLPGPGAPVEVACDGVRLQNTCFTPNHGYVASDVHQAAAVLGTRRDPRRDNLAPAWYPNNFDAYELTVNQAGDVVCSLSPPTGAAGFATNEDLLQDACRQDFGARSGTGRAPAVSSVPFGPPFSKRLTLRGRTIEVSYEGVAPGHEVANEFCLDLASAVLRGTKQTLSGGGQSLRLAGPGVGVTVTCLDNCEFTAAAALPTMPLAAGDPRTDATLTARQQEYGRLHRVLTDDLRIVCRDGGAFAYRITVAP